MSSRSKDSVSRVHVFQCHTILWKSWLRNQSFVTGNSEFKKMLPMKWEMIKTALTTCRWHRKYPNLAIFLQWNPAWYLQYPKYYFNYMWDGKIFKSCIICVVAFSHSTFNGPSSYLWVSNPPLNIHLRSPLLYQLFLIYLFSRFVGEMQNYASHRKNY